MLLKNKIKEVRQLKNIKQSHLASDSGITRQYLSEIEAGKKVPTITVAFRIVKNLNEQINTIFFDDDVNYNSQDAN
jgi:DNA-binding XRE family transcriptional regulator